VRSNRIDEGAIPGEQPPGGSTTTTTTPGTTPSTTPGTVPSDASVAELLNEAEREYGLADEALSARRLAEYEEHIANARRLVGRARDRLVEGSTTTTTRNPARNRPSPRLGTPTGIVTMGVVLIPRRRG
jgi:hypothetical protein